MPQNNEVITFELVKELAKKISEEIEHPQKIIGHDLFLELVQTCPQFITTWLNERPEFIEFCTI